MLLLERDDLMFSFDLKSGYHHVNIAQEHWKYLGFAWRGALLSPIWAFFCLLLYHQIGASGYWKAKGLRIVVYFDDGLCEVDWKAKVLEASALVMYTLEHAGFVMNISGHGCRGWALL